MNNYLDVEYEPQEYQVIDLCGHYMSFPLIQTPFVGAFDVVNFYDPSFCNNHM